MAWDLMIDTTGDLNGKIVNGGDEIVQRVLTRLQRHQGEWFLAVDAGLPWYPDLLGTKNRNRVNMLARREILETEGVTHILQFNPRWNNSTRDYSIYAQIVLTDGTVRSLTYATQ